MRILAIAPHPDDETLGCGGALFRHKAEGDDIYWLIITGISQEGGWKEKVVNKRDNEIDAVAEKYGFSDVFNLRLPTTKIDTLPISDLIGEISNVYKKVEPDIIYMPFAYDVHTDHQIIAKTLQSTLKWFRYPYIKKVYMYETPSETEFNFVEKMAFRPNVFVNISLYIDDKIEVMKIYANEMGEFPFPRSEKTLRALAILRGSQSGFESAEAFELVYERK
ncbi:MAG: PIG-L family deacetylase [Candidatus Marinimicrobia bacterium]|nr:PIG-L family deacetylase [Candidatus Neomarinimicrobiota bacterium]